MEHSITVLSEMEKVLPKYKGKFMVDVTSKCRQDQAAWETKEKDGVTILLFWTLYRISTCKFQLRDVDGTIHYVNRALSLFPPLDKDSSMIPSPYEIACLFYMAHAHGAMNNNQVALELFRACMAATRLHMHYNKDAAGKKTGLEFLMEKCDKVISYNCPLVHPGQDGPEDASTLFYSG
jgi:hypothetical protein